MPLYAFPFPAFDPVLINFGPFAIRWYALAYIVGILLGWLYARAIIRRERFWGSPVPMTVTDYDDFVLWVTLGIILGGRIGYVLFYNPSYFAAHPLESFQLGRADDGNAAVAAVDARGHRAHGGGHAKGVGAADMTEIAPLEAEIRRRI